jgi:AcrR family transcriptional regulator
MRTDTSGTSGDRTRERIERAALALFLERGYAGTPLRLIAEAAEVTTPAIYWHYQSKDDLCFTIVSREYREFGELVMAALEGQSPAEQLRAYVEAFVSVQLRRRTGRMQLGFDQLVASLPVTQRAGLAQVQRPLFETLRDILRAGMADGAFAVRDASVAALALISMCNYTFTWFRPGGPLTVDRIAQAYGDYAVRLALNGVAA